MGKACFWVCATALLVATCSAWASHAEAQSAYCVGPAATGSGSGLDWNNLKAWSSTPSRGDTWYLVDGSYAGRSFSVASPGSTLITIKKATVADHGGIAAGWSDTIGDGQAMFGDTVAFGTSYWVFDGVTGDQWTTDASAYGFAFATSTGTDVQLGISGGETISHVTVSHVYGQGSAGDLQKRFVGTIGGSGVAASSYITISHCYGVRWQNHVFIASDHDSAHSHWTIEYNLFTEGYSSATNHGEMIDVNYGSLLDSTIRYNVFRGWESGSGGQTGCIVANNSDMVRCDIYGNVLDDTRGSTTIIGGTLPGRMMDSHVYNNTIYSAYPSSGKWTDGAGGTGNVVENNLLYNTEAYTGTGIAYDYNAYFSCTHVTGEPHSQSASGDPLSNAAAFDYTPRVNTNPGTPLGSPYDIDPAGHMRTTWTRGAYEIVADGGTRDAGAPLPDAGSGDAAVDLLDAGERDASTGPLDAGEHDAAVGSFDASERDAGAITLDASARVDARVGAPDAGSMGSADSGAMPTSTSGGCGCRVVTDGAKARAPFAVGVLFALVIAGKRGLRRSPRG